MKFQFKIINTDTKKALNKYRQIFFFITMLLFFHYNRIDNDRYENVGENLLYNSYFILGLIFVFGLLTIILYYYSRPKVIGKLDISDTEIVGGLEGDLHSIPLSEIDYLQINRGATWHYSYQTNNELVKTNNRILIARSNEKLDYEFLIESKDHNKAFEQMIVHLRQHVNNFSYKSI